MRRVLLSAVDAALWAVDQALVFLAVLLVVVLWLGVAPAAEAATYAEPVLCAQFDQQGVCKGPVGSIVRFQSKTDPAQYDTYTLNETDSEVGIRCGYGYFPSASLSADRECWLYELLPESSEPPASSASEPTSTADPQLRDTVLVLGGVLMLGVGFIAGRLR